MCSSHPQLCLKTVITNTGTLNPFSAIYLIFHWLVTILRPFFWFYSFYETLYWLKIARYILCNPFLSCICTGKTFLHYLCCFQQHIGMKDRNHHYICIGTAMCWLEGFLQLPCFLIFNVLTYTALVDTQAVPSCCKEWAVRGPGLPGCHCAGLGCI